MNKLHNRVRDFGLQWHATTEMTNSPMSTSRNSKLPDGNLENWKMATKFAAGFTALALAFFVNWFLTTPAGDREGVIPPSLTVTVVLAVITIMMLVAIKFKKIKYGKFTYGEGRMIPLEIFHKNYPASQKGLEESIGNLCAASGYSAPTNMIGTIVDGKPRIIFTTKNSEGTPEQMFTDGKGLFPVEA